MHTLTRPSQPPSDAELLGDYWWYSGMLVALEDLLDELEIGDLREGIDP